MNCFCGCGRRVPRGLTEENLRLGEMALDLLAWDRYRTLGDPDPADLAEAEGLLDRGAAHHQDLLAAVHDEGGDHSLAAIETWLRDSKSAWTARPAMVERSALIRRPKLRLTEEDFVRLDRVYPEKSFSASASTTARTMPATGGSLPDNLVEELERLRDLHQEGLLDEEEFRAAKAKLLR